MVKRSFWLAAALACAAWSGPSEGRPAAASVDPVSPPSAAEFQAWLGDFKAKAAARGISAETLERAFAGAAYIPRVIELDRRQPEFTMTFWQYFDKVISDKRIARGRELLKTHAGLLAKVEAKYGVPPRFLVAFWGLESNFGDHTGSFPLIDSLATLAFDPRRSRFFAEQLLAALEIIDRGDIPPDVKASWAGAMGNTQFIPSTYRAYAVDFDGDGRRDLWRSLPDVFASSAHFLSQSGWRRDETWGREVRLPKGFDFALSGLDKKLKLKEWQAKGVRRADGRDLPVADLDAALVLPAGADGPAFLVYGNYNTILVWNRSILYALAVGHLADRLVDKGPLRAKKPSNDKPLSRADMREIQRRLADKGYDAGGQDGIAGAQTRRAIKAYQSKEGLAQDGHPDSRLLERLRDDGN
ncbi:MAG: lytic murein transglycosylase [Rhodospirillales bacterium CG15_BIG_FIL_POST_REV_8_21_14_020_66_15]|nr:MAG: lytic murein transglycosylase [Rhodospirillales bacterium CG15_BIG_FIL_POST_REV_8_21_14_020_66_15]